LIVSIYLMLFIFYLDRQDVNDVFYLFPDIPMHYNIVKVSFIHVIIFLNYHPSMLLLTLTDQCTVMKSSFLSLSLFYWCIHAIVSSPNDSHVVMLTSVVQLPIFWQYVLCKIFYLLTSVVLMMTCLFLLGECFDADDDNGRICGSITPDTVLYTLFRGKKIKSK
jgi:hypothetical protein